MFDSAHRRTIDSGTILDKENIVHLARADDRIRLSRRQVLEHCARTAVTAVASLLVARLFGLGDLLGAGYDVGHHAVVARYDARRFLATVHRNGARGHRWRDPGELSRAERPCIRHQRVPTRVIARRVANE